MKSKAWLFLVLFSLLNFSLSAQEPGFAQLKATAEKLYAERSFSKAHDEYKKAGALELSPADKRWVEFRLADTHWRSQAATQNSDTTQLDSARHDLDVLNRDRTRADEHDRVWAEVEESLGDFFWTRGNSRNWGEAWPHYQNALDWWAGARDIGLARERYLKIVWTLTRPPWDNGPWYFYGQYGNPVPLDILDNALKIAQSPNDKARAHYLIAMTLRQQPGDWDQRQRVVEEFEGAIKIGKTTDWYDDALYNYAEWLVSYGRVVPLKDGNWTQEPDYKRALELFRQLVKEFKEGETRYYDQAKQQISNITGVVLNVSVANVFLPDSEIQYALNWRNVKNIDLALYPVDLTRDVQMAGEDDRHNDWLQSIDLAGREKIHSWSRKTGDKGDYRPGADTVRLDKKLPPGAYVLEARAGGQSSRDLILVSDASVVLKASGKQALVYVCNALAGSPLADANVHLWERYYTGDNHWHWRDLSKKTGDDGIAVFDVKASVNNVQLFVGATLKDRQAFASSYAYDNYNGRNGFENWRIYAFTDRPAYRPKETVQWKFIARQYNGSVYSTPSGRTLEFQITDPRGAKVKEGKAELNTFGSAWGSLELTESMPLGEYNITFWDEGKKHNIGNASLFRLEEYKLPEFKVSVQTPEENGRKKAFRLGEKVEVDVQADYYFGGAVANASVEIIVHQAPFYHYWHRPHEFPWFYEDMTPEYQRGRYWGRGQDQIIKRETVKTDSAGKASLMFDTPRDSGTDLEFHIEARVTDSSRREITGDGNVRVTRQRYYVYPEPEHNLYRPEDKVTVDFKAQDANDQPVQTEGTVKVTRERWYEVWLDPNGREVMGNELKRLQSTGIFPPAPTKPGGQPWQLKFRGYEHDDILTRTLKTDTNGAAQLTFTPERDGYYRVAWSSQDNANTNGRPASPITAETMVWVATDATTELGYRQGGVEIIVDKDTFRVGQKAPVMLSVPTNDRYVLFTVEGADLYSYQLVHVTGTVKLVELPVEEKHVPNIFLGAALVSDRQIFTDQKQVVVPPTKNFISVDVKSDREQYQPREEGTFTITTRDDHDQLIAAEVAFGLVDESVYYIQSDYAGDPRQFYFGTKRQEQVQTGSTFNQKSYAKLVEGDNKELMDERDLNLRRQAGERSSFFGLTTNYVLGSGGGGGAELLSDASVVSESGRRSRLVEAQAAEPVGKFPGFAGEISGLSAAGGTMPAKAMGRAFLSLNAPATTPAALGMAPQPESAVQVRSDFRSTVFWQPDVSTGADGKAIIKIKYPDSLTGWKATARAVTEGNQFGIASASTHTKQPLIVRLEAPRFFVVGDSVVISAVVNNNTDKELIARVNLDADIPGFAPKDAMASELKVLANGEARADWEVPIRDAGEAKLKVTARGGKYADAMEKTYTIYEHGIEKFISKSGKVRGDDVTVKLDIPKERKAESTTLTVQVTPSLAVTMLDALPYLIDYPYGCTEQTMSRFLPAAITAKTLKDLGLKPEDVMGHLFGGIETNTAAASHPHGKHDLHELDDITKKSLARLYDFQHRDGGWGWWKEGDSDHFMTAYVLWGLSLAQNAGIEVKPEVMRRANSYLDKKLVEEELNLDEQAWMLHALSVYHALEHQRKVSQFQTKAFDNLWKNREQLNAYTRALLALAAHNYDFNEQARTLIANLENGVKIDNSPDQSVLINGAITNSPASMMATAHWGADGIYWHWSDGGVEATAFALRALLAIDPHNKLVEPVSNWLIKNRRGAQWSNTRDTAITVLAMNDYLRTSGELATDLEYEVLVNGQSIATKKISSAEVLTAPSRFAVDSKLIRDGDNDIRIVRRSGHGPIYFAANATYFSLEEPVTAAGNEIFVKRQYYKLAGRPTLLKGYVYDRELLNDGDTVNSGERVETVLTIEAKNNYEYLLFEDLKPAGLEAVEIRSGENLFAYELKSGAVDRKFSANTNIASSLVPERVRNGSTGRRRVRNRPMIPRPVTTDDDHTGRAHWVYEELRDRKVALFIDKLEQGFWEIKYDLRAEVPGKFHALPVMGHAMYVPEIRCNGTEVRIHVTDAK
jgi:hypothetical protein